MTTTFHRADALSWMKWQRYTLPRPPAFLIQRLERLLRELPHLYLQPLRRH
jgi:hypothetical protein